MTTIRSIPASAASRTAAATLGAGTKMQEAFAPVAAFASPTVAKMGMPWISVPPRPGLVPATTCVP
jgi:hypothetical protein